MAVVVEGGLGDADGSREDNKGSSVESGSGNGVVVVVVEVVSKLLSFASNSTMLLKSLSSSADVTFPPIFMDDFDSR